jgi:hypothetical protein
MKYGEMKSTEAIPKTDAPEVTISLSGLIDGFSNYAKTALRVLRHPFKFPETLDIDGESAFHNALSLVFYSITLLFFLLVPVFVKYSAEVSKVTFAIRFLVQGALYALLLHVGLRFIGKSKRDLRGTIVAYANLAAVTTPLFVILMYPFYLLVGPVALFGAATPNDYVRMTEVIQENPGLLLYSTAVTLVFGVFAWLVSVSWFSRTHQVSKVRVVLSYLLCSGVGCLIQMFILIPLFLATFEWVDRCLKYAG